MDATDTFDVVILGFDPRDETPEARLQRAFGIAAEPAAQIITRLPATVQRGVPRVRADYFARALVMAGAHVEIRDEYGAVVAPPTEATKLRDSVLPPEPARGTEPAPPPASLPSTSIASTLPAPAPFAPDAAAVPAAIVSSAPAVRTRAENSTLMAGPASAPRGPHDVALGIRPPAHPTLREASPQVDCVAPQPSAAASAPKPLWPPRDPSSIWDAPAPAAASPVLSARDPSSVWDAPPSLGQKTPQAAVPMLSASPHAAALPRSYRPSAAAPPSSVGALEGLELNSLSAVAAASAHTPALDSFDIAKSIAVGGLWRPQAAAAPAPAPAPTPAPAPALALDDDRVRGAGGDARARPNSARPVPNSARPTPKAARAVPAGAAGPAAARKPQPAQKPVVSAAERGARAAAQADLRSFWEAIPEALALPFGGAGVYWIVTASVWAIVAAGLFELASSLRFFPRVVPYLALSSLLALVCDYYRVCLWVPAASDSAIDRAPSADPAQLFRSYIKSGTHVAAFMLASQALAIMHVSNNYEDASSISKLVKDPATWLLVAPSLYWPMAVGLTALGNDFAAIWNVPSGLRAIARAPLEYATVVALGAFAFFPFWAGLLYAARALFGLSPPLIVATLGAPLALAHGITGALMGHVVRARAEAFE